MAEIDATTGCRKALRLIASVLLLVLLALVPKAPADELRLKDGQRLISPKAWVEGDYVYFILQGTADVEIRYALEIVDRIIADDGKQIYPAEAAVADTPVEAPAAKDSLESPAVPMPQPTPPKASATTAKIPQPSPSPVPSTPSTAKGAQTEAPSTPPGIDTKLLRARAKKLREVPFYDPRRPQKYWAASQSRHNDVKSAVAALADLFKQAPAWVTTHMGNTNDLSQIHLNLIRQIENRDPSTLTPTASTKDEKTTPKKPIKSGGKSPVKSPKTSSPKPAKASSKAVRSSNPFASNLPDTQGPMFYNPRRPKKFWANQTSHHNTIEGALKALAEQYGQPVEWVETHMGESNSLQEIHHNLTQASQKLDK